MITSLGKQTNKASRHVGVIFLAAIGKTLCVECRISFIVIDITETAVTLCHEIQHKKLIVVTLIVLYMSHYILLMDISRSNAGMQKLFLDQHLSRIN